MLGLKLPGRCNVKCIDRTIQSLAKWCYFFLKTPTLPRDLLRGQTGTVCWRKEECAWLQGKERGKKRSNGLRFNTAEGPRRTACCPCCPPQHPHQILDNRALVVKSGQSLCMTRYFLGAQHETKPSLQNFRAHLFGAGIEELCFKQQTCHLILVPSENSDVLD